MYKIYKIYKIYIIYEIYEIYKIYKMYKIYEEDIRKYRTDGRYPSQYNFYNRAKNRQLAGDFLVQKMLANLY